MNYSQLIEKYLMGELAGDELKKFIIEMENDPELARKVEILRSLQKVINKYHCRLIKPSVRKGIFSVRKDSIEEEIERDLEQYSSENFDNSLTSDGEFIETIQKVIEKGRNTRRCQIFRLRKIWQISACLLVLFSLPVIFFYLTANTKHIYNMYYEPLKLDIVQRGEPAAEDLFYISAIEYNKANFDLAIRLFDNIPDTSRYYPFAGLYKGISYMELGIFDSASVELEAVKNVNPTKDTALWYLGLCYLKQEQTAKALDIFEQISSNESPYSEKAWSIVKKINRYCKFFGLSI